MARMLFVCACSRLARLFARTELGQRHGNHRPPHGPANGGASASFEIPAAA